MMVETFVRQSPFLLSKQEKCAFGRQKQLEKCANYRTMSLEKCAGG